MQEDAVEHASSQRNSVHFTVQGDGRTRGDDAHGGELAALTLYVARGRSPLDGLLGVGRLRLVRLNGAIKCLQLQVSQDGEFGTGVEAILSPVTGRSPMLDLRARAASVEVEIRYLLSAVSELDLVAGCFLVSSTSQVVAETFPESLPMPCQARPRG